MDGSGKIAGTIVNKCLRSIDCTKIHNKNRKSDSCVKCCDLKSKLDTNLQKVHKILENPNTLPPYSSIIPYPQVMYQLLRETTKALGKCEPSNFETKIIESLRKAKAQYEINSSLKSKHIKMNKDPTIENKQCEQELLENEQELIENEQEFIEKDTDQSKQSKKTDRYTHVPPQKQNGRQVKCLKI
ncbi:predicted protein [Naegleria gruberi]|uniref:Predicted protein n=1 Tax=Naegleria gruberi TaxID=5762 RepID=D2W6E6_NAEGR|nr:uncharacterized protein NAEGRDRAFT_76989 [Naegleria gruberi]EFC35356.1 predicted protein [Naegleria gruberi]|eukprot:XP_002668100.1 predicted protein [Naegleria gruberi strain NEG-M]